MSATPNTPQRTGSSWLWLAAGITVGAVIVGGLVWAGYQLWSPSLPEAMAAPTFVEEAASGGVEHRYEGDFTYFVGGGVGVFDCDQDNKPDLFFAGGSAPSALYRNAGVPGGSLAFHRQSGIALDGVTGAYPLDVDGDAVIDLAVLRYGENVMLRGLGHCQFERANEIWNVDGGSEWTAAFSAKWEDGAGMPTMAFGNYLAPDGRQTGECSDHFLFRPQGHVYGIPTRLSPGWCTLSVLFSDWDRSGRGDLRMTNDRHYYNDGQEQLWRVAAGTEPILYTEADGWQRMQIWGMGIASQDLTGDGLPEVFLTSQGDNKLQTLVGGDTQPHYADIAFERRVTAHRPFAGGEALPSTAWHAEFEDVNNDTFMDLYIAKGNVEAQEGYASLDPSNLLLGGRDGTFTEGAIAAGLVNFGRARGGAVVDLNLDGMLDLVEVNRRSGVELWRNTGRVGNWLQVELRQPEGNRNAIGAWLEVDVGSRVISRELVVGGGHAGGQLGWTHVGLGEASSAKLRVIWPDGEASRWWRVEANQFLTVAREEGPPARWEP